MRRAARRDANEPGLVQAAREMGMKVFYTNELGDWILQYLGFTHLIEVKTETGKLTPAQCRRKQQGLLARVIRSVHDLQALRAEIIRDASVIQKERTWPTAD